MVFGKLLFAKEFAKRILCLNKENDESCLSCIKYKSNNHPDFKQIEPDGNSIKIEQIREMQEDISQKPITSENKVYIINNSDLMTKEAQNCLLKTLEEPPEYAVIILITSNDSKLLTTVKSRCTKVLFNSISNDDIEKYLYSNYGQTDSNIITMSEGSIGKAIKLLDNKEIYLEINNILDKIDKEDLIWILNNSEVIYKQKENIYEVLDYICSYLYKIGKINCIKYVEETKRRLNANSNYDMTIDYLLIKVWEEVN